jgi:transglutaminase/protease-like cytokinesis protein 3
LLKNIQVNCVDHNKEEAAGVYNSGTGTFIGISALFNTMCSIMNIESLTIAGFTKRWDDVKNTHRLCYKAEHYWNYILINNTYYLVDPTLSSGFCYGVKFQKEYLDYYFGTKPEFLINTHFPIKEKYQFLENKISEEKWDQLIMRTPRYYLNGMISITPESLNINLKDEKKIVINYDDSIKDEEIKIALGIINKNYERIVNQKDIKKENGIVEISLENVDDDTIGLLVYTGDHLLTSVIYNKTN